MVDDTNRPTIALAREIASWDQDTPGTNRIPHWSLNLAAHLLDKGYGKNKLLADAHDVGYRQAVYDCTGEEHTDYIPSHYRGD